MGQFLLFRRKASPEQIQNSASIRFRILNLRVLAKFGENDEREVNKTMPGIPHQKINNSFQTPSGDH